VLDIMLGAIGNDGLVVENKVAVGTYYLTQTVNNQVPMTPESAHNVLQGVDLDAASVAAGKALIDLFVAETLLPIVGIAT